MKRKFLPLIMLFSAIILMSSCLSSNDEEITYNEDTAITSFSLGTLNETVYTKASTGVDSTYSTTLDCSGYKFNIDQPNRLIYNQDSLPYGIDASKVICTIGSKNSGAIILTLKATDGKDSLAYYSSSDSLDFTNPMKVSVYSQSGLYHRDYTIQVNVHKEPADSFIWQSLPSNSKIAALRGMRAINCNNTLYVFGSNGSSTVIYSTGMSDGRTWTVRTPNITLTQDAYKETFAKEGYLYTLDNGVIYKSADASTWSAIASTNVKHLLGASTSKIYALTNNGIVSSTDDGATWNNEELDDDPSLLPTQDLNFYCAPLATNKETNRLLIMGNRSENSYATDSVAQIWGKIEENGTLSENQKWTYFSISSNNLYMAPRLRNIHINGYAGDIIAFGGDGIGANVTKGYAHFYMSHDGGITWHKDGNDSIEITVPDGFSASSSSFAMTVDSDQYIWLFCGQSGQVWKGRLTNLGWRKEQTEFTE